MRLGGDPQPEVLVDVLLLHQEALHLVQVSQPQVRVLQQHPLPLQRRGGHVLAGDDLLALHACGHEQRVCKVARAQGGVAGGVGFPIPTAVCNAPFHGLWAFMEAKECGSTLFVHAHACIDKCFSNMHLLLNVHTLTHTCRSTPACTRTHLAHRHAQRLDLLALSQVFNELGGVRTRRQQADQGALQAWARTHTPGAWRVLPSGCAAGRWINVPLCGMCA